MLIHPDSCMACIRAAAGGALGMSLLAATPASAQDQSFEVRAGALFATVDTDIKIDPTDFPGSGTEIDLESDLDLDRSTQIGFIEANYRFAPRWSVSFQYLRLSRRQGATLARDIQVGETVYPVNARVEGRFASNLYRTHVTWAFYQSKRAELSASVGAHLTDFTLSVEGAGSIGGVGGATREERREVLAPLPNVGLKGSFRVANRVHLTAEAKYFQLRIDELKGGLTDLEAAIAYRATRNFSVGAGYRFLGYRLDADRERFQGSVRYDFSGPILFVTAAF